MNRQRNPVRIGIKIEVDAIALQKFWHWVDMAQGEVSALGIVEEIPGGLRVTDFHLVKQVSSDMDTELDPQGVAELMMEVKDPAKLRCWVHSHGLMQVFWSTTDDACIEGLANGEWMLSLVVNKQRHTMMRLDQYHPCHMYIDDVVFDVHYPEVKGLQKECQKEFKTKVKETPMALDISKPRSNLHREPAELPYSFLPEDFEDIEDWEEHYYA